MHFLNAQRPASQPPFTLRQVISLENRDEVSTEFRPFKQLIERLNRTYKHHLRSACGFATQNGAVALTTLFVTHYNFLRSHAALDYGVPVPLPELSSVATLQGRWNRVLDWGAYGLCVVPMWIPGQGDGDSEMIVMTVPK